jgi:hypothetical protein
MPFASAMPMSRLARGIGRADDTPILSQIATHSEYHRRKSRGTVTLLQQRCEIAPGARIFSFAILAKPGLLANNPHR